MEFPAVRRTQPKFLQHPCPIATIGYMVNNSNIWSLKFINISLARPEHTTEVDTANPGHQAQAQGSECIREEIKGFKCDYHLKCS